MPTITQPAWRAATARLREDRVSADRSARQLGMPSFESAEGPRELLKPDGTPFADELHELEQLLSGLHNEDRIAFRNRNAAAIAGHDATRLLVVAGPGAGKSFLFLGRIRHWLAERDGPSIYVASFVRKLVADLKSEIAAQLSEEDANRVTATTLHALARSLVERNRGGGDLSLRPHVKVMPPPRWNEMVWRDGRAFHPDIQGSFGIAAMQAQFHDDAFSSDPEWRRLLATYDQLRRFYNAVGFPDMIVTARAAVEDNPDLIEHDFWIFDEFQDFNTAEAHLVAAVTARAAGVLIAGDDEQALYQALKGSHPEIIVAYYEDPGFAKAMLPYCSRCSYYICKAASAFIERHRAAEGIAKVFIPLQEEPTATKVQVVAASVPSTAVNYVREFLEQNRDELAAHQAAMDEGSETDPFLLILAQSRAMRFFRTKDADQELFALLEEWSAERFEHSDDYWRVATYCSANSYPEDNFAVRKVLWYEGFSYADAHELIADALDRSVPLSATRSAKVGEALDRCKQVADIVESDELRPIEIATACAAILQIANPERLASELAADPIKRGAAKDEGAEIGGPSRMASVELLSIVGAKGLSAPHVILLGCDNVNLGATTPLAFYVALTRARKSLHLIVAGQAGGADAPHEYVLELPENCCEYRVHKKSGRDDSLDGQQAVRKRFAMWAAARARARRPT
jgi:superfamily I DNA/RNA helicase